MQVCLGFRLAFFLLLFCDLGHGALFIGQGMGSEVRPVEELKGALGTVRLVALVLVLSEHAPRQNVPSYLLIDRLAARRNTRLWFEEVS